MKQLVTNYSFNAAAKTVTFKSLSSIELGSILLITNTTRNLIIYNFADAAAGGTVAGNVLTLTYNTAAQANADRLQIFIDDGLPGPSTVSGEQGKRSALVYDAVAEGVLGEVLEVLKEIKEILLGGI